MAGRMKESARLVEPGYWSAAEFELSIAVSVGEKLGGFSLRNKAGPTRPDGKDGSHFFPFRIGLSDRPFSQTFSQGLYVFR